MSNKATMYQIYKTTFFVKGFNRTLVFDSQKSKVHFLPNDIADELDRSSYFTEGDFAPSILDFLKSKDLIFKFSDSKLIDSFIPVNNDYDIPYSIITTVVELSQTTSRELDKLKSLNTVQFNIILSHYTSKIDIELLVEFMHKTENDTFEITLCEGFIHHNYLFELLNDINKIIMLNNYGNLSINDNSKRSNRFNNEIDTKSLFLSLSYLTYFESIKKHIYFNKKLYISKEGHVKNTRESKKIMGTLDMMPEIDFDLFTQNDDFTIYWNITKENCYVCNECEFRRFCVDNRTPINSIHNKDKWYYESECIYNPYISKWQEEDGYLTLDECGILVNDEGVTKDIDLLNSINNELWKN